MNPQTREEWQDDEINLLDYWRPLKKHAWMILGLTSVSIFVAGFTTYFLMTKIYQSKATVLAPKEAGGFGGGLVAALTQSAAAPLLGDLLPSTGGTNRDAFVSILKSRTMAQDLVEKFNLKDHYKAMFSIDAINALETATEIKLSKEGVISVTVEDRDPKLAADIANAYVTNLDRLFGRLGTSDASRQRAFIAERLDKTEKSLRQTEDALRRFQEQNKMVEIKEQARSAIEENAKVKGQIILAESQLEYMRAFSTETNPQILAQKRQIEELKRQLGQMQYGRGVQLPPESANPGEGRREFRIPITQVPELGMELIRLTRDVKIQETVYSLLTAQYEQAKINEARDTPTVHVLDKAVPAERKYKPSTTLNMAIAGALSLFIGILLAFFLEYLGEIRKREEAAA